MKDTKSVKGTWRVAARALAVLCPLYGFVPAPLRDPGAPPPAVFPRGTRLPIRFLNRLSSGRDVVGAPVLVQTMGALVSDSCVVVPPFAQVRGRVALSRGGGRFGRPGQLRIAFDSLEVRRGTWAPLDAVLDTLEYAPRRDVTRSGTYVARRVSIGKRLLPVGVAEAADVGVLPAALLGGYLIVRRGRRAKILAGEVGGLRLVAPLTVSVRGCAPAMANADLTTPPELLRFTPRAQSRSGRPWDPVNLMFLGSGPALDTAFAHAGWLVARRRTTGAVVLEALAAIASRPAVSAPVTTEYLEGREQDAAFELPGPNARIRHHIRIWLLDTLGGLWVGAATQDVGILVTKRTHRINPDVDLERDRIVRDLEATGCADLVRYVRLPGAVTRARTPEGQPMISDGRAAVVRLKPCDPM